jgi:predicted AlkP superfamily pyrophosphatase or phosphodiesterase
MIAMSFALPLRVACKIASASLLLAATVATAAPDRHVIMVVWDGLRPDFVTPEYAPRLYEFAATGVTFKNHRAVFISTTVVNGTALATGAHPQDSGIIANREFRPRVNPTNAVGTEAISTVRLNDSLTGGRHIALETVAELVQRNGGRSVVASAKTVGLIHDRSEKPSGSTNVTLFEGRTVPDSCAGHLAAECGPFPAGKKDHDDWTTRALIGPLWADGVPDYSVLWLCEPDATQHATAPGSPESLAALRRSDENFGRVLAALKERGVRARTDIIVVSDHGFSSFYVMPDVIAALRSQGIRATKEKTQDSRPGDVLVVMVGGAALLYVDGAGRQDVEKVVRVLQEQPFTGVIFARESFTGTFPLQAARIASADAPDLAVSIRWSAAANSRGVSGLIATERRQAGPEFGTHGSLSPFDMHNTCIAAGPSFKRGVQSCLPSGNVDVAPTILQILGIQPRSKLAGRVLHEALVGDAPVHVQYQPHRLESVHAGKGFTWRQYLNYSEVNGVFYFEEGNGTQLPASAN